MNGSIPRKVLVYEYVTGGGLAGQELPESWATEGSAMRRAIASDFASVPGVRVVSTIDARLAVEETPGVEFQVWPDPVESSFQERVASFDHTLLIAPETDDILARLTDRLNEAGGSSLGSSSGSIRITGDKARLAHLFLENEIPTPETRMIQLPGQKFPESWNGPIVVKPRFGAGSVDTVIVRNGRCPDWVIGPQSAIAQPYLPGRPMSASFLVDVSGKMTLLGVGEQRIEVDPEGRISYRGGTILSHVNEAPKFVERAISSVVEHLSFPNLKGFVGVDYLDGPKTGVTVLEINPRPTTSYVGLAKLLGPGTIAGAWLDAMLGPLDATDWPGRIRSARRGPDLSFLADGTFDPREFDR